MAAKVSTVERTAGSVVVRVLEDICDVDPTSISRSIFVTGFKTTTKSEDLIIHFQRKKNGGGDIESITISKRGTAVITFDSPDVVTSVVQHTQEYDGVILTVEPYLDTTRRDNLNFEVFEMVSAELCLDFVESLSREQTKILLDKVAEKTGVKWIELAEKYVISGSFKQVEESRECLQNGVLQSNGIVIIRDMSDKETRSGPRDGVASQLQDEREHIKETRPALEAEDEGRLNHERIDEAVTDDTAPATSNSSEIGSFEIEPKILKVFVKARVKELDAIETKYKVKIPRLTKESNGKFTLKAKQGCSTEEFTEACNLFIDHFQEMYQLIKMERFCLKSEEKVIRAREEISKMGKQFPVSVERSKNHKQWELYGEANHIEEALEYLKRKGIEIKRESKTKGNERGTRKILKHDEEDMDVDQSEHSRGDSSSVDAIETYLGKVRLSVHKGDITNEQVDVIVSASNRELDHSGGVAMAILSKGGNIIKEESQAIIKKRGMLKDGEAVATEPGNLPCRAVVHVVGPRWDVGATKSKKILYRACVNSLCETQKMKMASIALPAIGSGMHGMPKDVCAEVMLDAVDKFVRQGDPKTKTITDIRFVNTDEPSSQAFGKELKSRYESDLVKVTPGKPVVARGGRSNRGRNYKGGEPDNNRSAKKPNHVTSSQPNHTSFGLSAADDRHPLSASVPSSYSGAVKGSADGADKHPPITHQLGGHENEMGFSLPPAAGEDKTDSKKEKECPICLDTISNPQSLKCKHVFCSACLKTALDVSNKCPICQEPQGVLQGNQPQGEMKSRVERHQHLPGYEAYGTIVIDYRFPSGVQGREHPNPGQYYEGTYRAAYLPDNREGREVLQLLRKAFDARLVFTIGTSNTTGLENQITWNDIHHKTNIYGGPFRFGYPDPDYLRRVKEELAAKGIR